MSVSTKKGTVLNEDLTRERDKCSFNVEELTNAWDGGSRRTEKRRLFVSKVCSDKRLADPVPDDYLSHKEKYEKAVRKVTVLKTVMDKHDAVLDGEDELFKTRVRSQASMSVFNDFTPLSLHASMFIPALRGQATDEQQRIWLTRANNYEIIGTYAQTELGHGTFLRGLETTATYDEAAEEFVIHSPSLTAYKWWPGALGQTVNYCVLMAQLITKGRNCGVHPFLVQIRDEDTHYPLPGIKVGEIGTKLGFNTVNNGFLGFDKHRIPMDRMLMRNAQVLKDGTFLKSKISKGAYVTMVYVRCTIVETAALNLSIAATIAVRYSAVRRQSKIRPSEPENQILDYFTQQHKLFIAIAASVAYRLTAGWLRNIHDIVIQEVASGKDDDLPELHSLACCLKAVSSSDCAMLVEQCRLACGGHGFMKSSKLPLIYGTVTASCTYEGENTVLLLQTARSLIKEFNMYKRKKRASPTSQYLFLETNESNWSNTMEGIILGFQQVAAGKLKSCVEYIQQLEKQGMLYEDAWNNASIRLVSLSESHCRAVVLSTFSEEMARLTANLSLATRTVLERLTKLYAIYLALTKRGDLLMYTSISCRDLEELESEYERLLVQLRPDVVGLVDAFDFRDETVGSALGAYDGRVYERLMKEALKSPLNAEPVNSSFHKYLKPFMRGKL